MVRLFAWNVEAGMSKNFFPRIHPYPGRPKTVCRALETIHAADPHRLKPDVRVPAVVAGGTHNRSLTDLPR